jgi:uncharacterized protein (TIGR03437 family)
VEVQAFLAASAGFAQSANVVISNIPLSATAVNLVVDGPGIAAGALPGGQQLTQGNTTLTVALALSPGGPYRIRVIATQGGLVQRSGKATGVEVGQGSSSVNVPITLGDISATLDPASPTVGEPGRQLVVKLNALDPGDWLEGTAGNMHLSGSNNPFSTNGQGALTPNFGSVTKLADGVYQLVNFPTLPITGNRYYFQVWTQQNTAWSSITFASLYLPNLNNVGAALYSVGISPGSCLLQLSQSSQTFAWNSSKNNVLSFRSSCDWTATTDANWISLLPASGVQATSSSGISGVGDGTVLFTVAENDSPQTRVGRITVAAQVFTITQTGMVSPVSPTVSASPTTLSFTSAGVSNPPSQALQISGSSPSLSFTAIASSSTGWLSVTPTSGSTPATLSVSANQANLSAGTYNGTITVNGTNGATGTSTVNVTLTVTPPLPTINTVVNAASYATGAVSPGEIISIGGSAIGPAIPAFLALDQSGNVSTSLGGAQVLFNGIAAPLIYVSSTQINSVVPYQIAGTISPFVQVKFMDQTSNALSLSSTTTAPAIFTLNASGTGPGAILNQDNSTNSPNNPAAKGSYVMLYLTGEGQTVPPGVTGKVTTVSASLPLTPQPVLPVGVLIDGQAALVSFYGEAPGFVSGVMQINVQIPPNAPSGNLPIQVSIGGNSSQNGVTVSVQ